MKRVILLSVVILLISLAYSFAEVPCKINYQGRLIKDNVPVDGTKTMKFSIHDSAVGPTLLWTSGNVSVEVHNGLFRYVLDLSSIDWTAGETLYLEVEVETEILTPREELSAYPYAINSHLLEGRTKEYFINTSGETQTKQGNLNIMGNVGIGTTGPAHILDIIQPNSTVRIGWSAVNLDDGSTGFTVGDSYLHLGGSEYKADSHRLISFGFQNTANSQMPAYIGYLQTNASGWTKGDLVFGTRNVITDTAPVERMRIDTAGKVGIGTPSPGEKLTVTGTIESTSGGVKFPDGTVQTTAAAVFGFWTDKDSANNTLIKDAIYKVGSDGTVIALISCSGMSNYDRGYITSYTDGSNSPTTDRGYAGYMQYGTNITKASITMPVRKDDYWKVTFTRLGGSCAVTITIYWIPIGSGSCVKQ